MVAKPLPAYRVRVHGRSIVNIASSMHIIITKAFRRSDGLVQQQRFADVLDLGNRTLQVKGLGQNNLEDLLQVSRAEADADGMS
jgi:hypothetical protein